MDASKNKSLSGGRISVTECKIKPKSDLTSINAPAYPYAADAVVYTALCFPMSYTALLPLPFNKAVSDFNNMGKL